MARTITRWEPFGEIAEMRSRFDRLLSDLADGEGRAWTPAVDVVRDNGHLVVRANVPGIKPEEIEIKVENDVLTISGEHEETTEETDKTFVRRERRYGAFSRSMPLPHATAPHAARAAIEMLRFIYDLEPSAFDFSIRLQHSTSSFIIHH